MAKKDKMKPYLDKLKPYLDRIKPYLDKASAYISENKRILKIILILFFAMWLTSHIKSCQRQMAESAIYPRTIQTARATKKDVPLYVDSFGTLSSPEDVDIKAQVTGKILEVNFKQGTEVAKGDLLFTIDPKEYEADVEKAKGALAQDEADLELKKITLARNEQLIDKDLVSKQDIDQYKTDVLAAEAQVELDRASLELAKINLEYCYIRSPIDGLTGKRQVDVGNIVSANTGPVLVNIKKIDKLYLDFTLPERDLVKVRKAMKENALNVEVTVPGEEDTKYSGVLQFVDNVVDDDTGTFALRAIVDNESRDLWAGQFVDVRLILGIEKGATVVPYDAVQIGKKGYYVFVAKRKKADLRVVEVGTRQEDNIVIEKGVKPGEVVVTVGQLGLSPGYPVIDVTKIMKKKEAEAKKREAKKLKQ